MRVRRRWDAAVRDVRRHAARCLAAALAVLSTGGAVQASEAYVTPSVLAALETPDRFAAKAESRGTTARRARVIVTFDVTADRASKPAPAKIAQARAAVRASLAGLPTGAYRVMAEYSHLPALAMEIDRAALDALRRDARVAAINDDAIVRATLIQAKSRTRVGQAPASAFTGAGIKVAIIDSGVDTDHPGLAGDLLGSDCFRLSDNCGGNGGEDQNGHGTHVSGIVTGPDGVAPGAKFFMARVLDAQLNQSNKSDVLNALNFIIANQPTLDFDLINLSLSTGFFTTKAQCDQDNQDFVTAFATLNGMGVSVFAAAGNEGRLDGIGAPGCVTGVIAVGSSMDTSAVAEGAVDDILFFGQCAGFRPPQAEHEAADRVSCYSNAHPSQGIDRMLDLYAPGCAITSTGLNGSNNFGNCGTSMSTPFALGVGALALQAARAGGGDLTPAQLEALLRSTGVPISDFRSALLPTVPRVDAAAAITALGSVPPPPPNIALDRASIEVSLVAGQGTDETLVVSNTGGELLSWTIAEAGSVAGKRSDAHAVPQGTTEAIQDGGFENAFQNPSSPWTSGSTLFGSALCESTVSACQAPNTGPRTGEGFVFFGGDSRADSAFVQQALTIPPGSAQLSFFLKVPARDQPGTLTVKVDSTVLTTFNQGNTAGLSDYQHTALGLDAFADGGSHTIRFESTTSAVQSGFITFLIDDVALTVDSAPQEPCDAPADVPWLSVSPAAGSASGGTSSDVTVSFDATGLTPGAQSASLCIDSNDSDTARTEVPVSLTVTASPAGSAIFANGFEN